MYAQKDSSFCYMQRLLKSEYYVFKLKANLLLIKGDHRNQLCSSTFMHNSVSWKEIKESLIITLITTLNVFVHETRVFVLFIVWVQNWTFSGIIRFKTLFLVLDRKGTPLSHISKCKVIPQRENWWLSMLNRKIMCGCRFKLTLSPLLVGVTYLILAYVIHKCFTLIFY